MWLLILASAGTSFRVLECLIKQNENNCMQLVPEDDIGRQFPIFAQDWRPVLPGSLASTKQRLRLLRAAIASRWSCKTESALCGQVTLTVNGNELAASTKRRNSADVGRWYCMSKCLNDDVWVYRLLFDWIFARKTMANRKVWAATANLVNGSWVAVIFKIILY